MRPSSLSWFVMLALATAASSPNAQGQLPPVPPSFEGYDDPPVARRLQDDRHAESDDLPPAVEDAASQPGTEPVGRAHVKTPGTVSYGPAESVIVRDKCARKECRQRLHDLLKNTRKGRTTGDMYPWRMYYPVQHGYYYFRPYNPSHLVLHAQRATLWGAAPGFPYTTTPEMFEPIYNNPAFDVVPPPEEAPQPEERQKTSPADHFEGVVE